MRCQEPRLKFTGSEVQHIVTGWCGPKIHVVTSLVTIPLGAIGNTPTGLLAHCIPRSSWVVCAKQIDKSRNESERGDADTGAPEARQHDTTYSAGITITGHTGQTRNNASACRYVLNPLRTPTLTNTNRNRRPTALGA